MLRVRAGVDANTNCVAARGNDLIGETFNEQSFGVFFLPHRHPPPAPLDLPLDAGPIIPSVSSDTSSKDPFSEARSAVSSNGAEEDFGTAGASLGGGTAEGRPHQCNL
jgi:hypothetical protein